jgi:uncharacterized membrane protein
MQSNKITRAQNSELKDTNYKFIIPWIIIFGMGFLLLLWGITHEDLWYDECYSATIIKHSIFDICKITAGDSHPPLYYMILKFTALILGNNVFALRFCSLIGIFFLALLGFFPIRRTCGNTTGMIYTILVFVTPMSYSYAQEARMYSWAAFFVTATAIYAYLSATENLIINWVKLGIFSLAAAYTHYYSLLSVFIVNFLLLVYLILMNRKKLIDFFSMAVVAIVMFLPWTIFLSSQVKRIHGNYWIPKFTMDTLFQTLVFPFNHKFTNDYKQLLPIYLIAIIFILFGFISSYKKNVKKNYIPEFAILIYVLTILSGIVISFIFRPLLIPRYMLVVLGLFLLGIAHGISQIPNKKLTCIVIFVVILVSTPEIVQIHNQRFNGAVRESVTKLKKQLKPGDIFVHVNGTTFGTFCYYFPNTKNFFYQKPGSVWYSDYDAFKPNNSYGPDINSVLKQHKTVYLVEQFNPTTKKALYDTLLVNTNKKLSHRAMTFSLHHAWFDFTIQKVSSKDLIISNK